MPNKSSQVQKLRALKRLSDPRQSAEHRLAMLAEIRAMSSAVFREAPRSKRRYPGESAATEIFKYLSEARIGSAGRNHLIEALDVLRQYEDADNRKDVATMRRLFIGKATLAYDRLTEIALREHRLVGVRDEGLILQPKTRYGQACFGILLLFEKRRLDRIRTCLHCRKLFFARFKHQTFCDDPKTRCQWMHYHSSEWRKEQNRIHQRKYRKRYRGRKG
jgi:hypothetical protein